MSTSAPVRARQPGPQATADAKRHVDNTTRNKAADSADVDNTPAGGIENKGIVNVNGVNGVNGYSDGGFVNGASL